MNIYWKIGSYVLVAAAAVGAVSWYGSSKYQDGYDRAKLEASAAATELSEKRRREEQAAKQKADDEYSKFKTEQAKTTAANNDLAYLADSLRRDTAILKRRLSESANDPKRAITIGVAGIGSYEACRSEYIEMGKELAGLSDKHNGLIAQCK